MLFGRREFLWLAGAIAQLGELNTGSDHDRPSYYRIIDTSLRAIDHCLALSVLRFSF